MLVDHTYAAVKTLGEIFKSTFGDNPPSSLAGVTKFIQAISAWALDVVGMLAVTMIIWGAWGYTTAYGDDTKTERAKKTLVWAIVGLLVVIMAHVITGILFTF